LAAAIVMMIGGGCESDGTGTGEPSTMYTVTDPRDATGQLDFRQLTVIVFEDAISVEADIWGGRIETNGGNHVYLYGTYRDLITFDSAKFAVKRDLDANGHFETTVDSGVVRWFGGRSVQFLVSRATFPDIELKRVWGYSMASRDLIPNDGYLYISDAAN